MGFFELNIVLVCRHIHIPISWYNDQWCGKSQIDIEDATQCHANNVMGLYHNFMRDLYYISAHEE